MQEILLSRADGCCQLHGFMLDNQLNTLQHCTMGIC